MSNRINASDVRSFVAIAVKAGVGKIGWCIIAAVLACNDVIDARDEWVSAQWKPAVFTPSSRSSTNETSNGI
jgi:hypothetical protein